jgi:hypothetical protein
MAVSALQKPWESEKPPKIGDFRKENGQRVWLSMAKTKYEIKLPPYARKYDFVKQDLNLTWGERDVLCEAFRYWPENDKVSLPPQSTMTDNTIAKNLGYKDKTSVEKKLKTLVEKGYIYRETVTRMENGVPKSRRVMQWLKFPTPAKQRVGNPLNRGSATRQKAEKYPPNSGPTINDYNNNNKRAMPAPLPAEGQASALLKTPKPRTLSPQEREQRKQKMISDLKKS